MGAGELNYRVRNGNGCGLTAIVTGKVWRRVTVAEYLDSERKGMQTRYREWSVRFISASMFCLARPTRLTSQICGTWDAAWGFGWVQIKRPSLTGN